MLYYLCACVSDCLACRNAAIVLGSSLAYSTHSFITSPKYYFIGIESNHQRLSHSLFTCRQIFTFPQQVQVSPA